MNHPESRHTDTAAEAEKNEAEKGTVRGNTHFCFVEMSGYFFVFGITVAPKR